MHFHKLGMLCRIPMCKSTFHKLGIFKFFSCALQCSEKLMKIMPLQCIFGSYSGTFLQFLGPKSRNFLEFLPLQCILSFSTLTVQLEDAKKPTLSARTYPSVLLLRCLRAYTRWYSFSFKLNKKCITSKSRNFF